MKEIYDKILSEIEVCSKAKKMFFLPEIVGCKITESEPKYGGPTLYKIHYQIEKGEEKIEITYESKDKSKSFQVKPDLNIVTVKYTRNNEIVGIHNSSWEDQN